MLHKLFQCLVGSNATGFFAKEEEITKKMRSMKLPFLEKEICFAHQQTNDVGWAHGSHNIAWISLSSLLSSSFFWDWMIFLAVSVRINQHSQISYYQLLLILKFLYHDNDYIILSCMKLKLSALRHKFILRWFFYSA